MIMGINLKEGLLMEWPKEKENFFIIMVIGLKEDINMIRGMVTVFIIIEMGQDMMEILKMVKRMEME